MTERSEEVAQGAARAQGLGQGTDAVDPETFSSPLTASALNIDAKSRSNLFPWRGQFSPELVEALLRAYAPSGATVLDPFMGSGTVLIESARLGLPTNGCEVNPAAYLLGRVYELCNLDPAERHDLLDKAESILTRVRPTAFELPLFRMASGSDSLPSSALAWMRAMPDTRVRMLLEALVVLADGDAASDDAYANKWSTIRKIVANLPFTTSPVRACLCDARSLHLPDRSIDFVLSSPPYINVFNYHHNLRAGIESLGWKPLVVARSEIGANRKFRQNRFLTVVQYCIDMALALAELRRVCNYNARILLILGRESNVHKTAFYNGQLVEKLASQVVGLKLELKQERVFVNKFGKDIHEDILHLTLPHEQSRPEREMVEPARRLAKDALVEAHDRTPGDRKHYLHDAICRADQVEESPILAPTAAVGDAL